jgi:hypothetical protein
MGHIFAPPSPLRGGQRFQTLPPLREFFKIFKKILRGGGAKYLSLPPPPQNFFFFYVPHKDPIFSKKSPKVKFLPYFSKKVKFSQKAKNLRKIVIYLHSDVPQPLVPWA